MNNRARAVFRRTVFLVVLGGLTWPRAASACDVVDIAGRTPNASDWVRSASLIVRARAATDHAIVPSAGSGGFGSDGAPLAFIDFYILEVLKGDISETQLRLPGFLVDQDRFNHNPVPYSTIEAAGSCYSDLYKRAGEYLLILFRQPTGAYSARVPLAPLNEQLRGPDDPWLRWVREELAKRRLSNR